jgi:hypothetical protein
MHFRYLLSACLAVLAGALCSAPALANDLGSQHQGRLSLSSRQVPLPIGEWTVVGHGTNKLVSGAPGAFGMIENTILARRVDGRIDALIEINVNRLPVSNGWGSANACSAKDGLATVAFYKTGVDGFCLFVQPTELGAPNAPGPDAWLAARPLLHEGASPPSDLWLTVGFRVSDRRDVLDVRYHFDPSRLNLQPVPAQDWKLEAVLKAPDRYAAVNQLTTWGGLAAGLVQDGFWNSLSEQTATAALPNPWEVAISADTANGHPSTAATGRVSATARVDALDKLLASGVISAADHAAYLKAINDENAKPPPNPDDYYRLLGFKVISFNFFRVSVDYILAFVVTVNSLISGYITATIVATHSVAQVFNDMWWDNYIATQANSNTVDFVYIGSRSEGVS